MEALTAMPARLTAGTYLKYTRSYADYPANAGWGLRLIVAGTEYLATASGANFVVEVFANVTADLVPGTYTWTERVTKSPEVYDVARGQVIIDQDPATLTPQESQSFEERTLAVIEAALSGRLTKDLESYQIDGVAVNKIAVTELEKLRVKYRNAVTRMRNGGRLIRTHKVSFPRS